MAVSQSDIDALNNALTNGERVVNFADGRRVEYHTPDQIIRAIKHLQTEHAREAGKGKPRRTAVRLYHGGRGFT